VRVLALAVGLGVCVGCSTGSRQATPFRLDDLTLSPDKLPAGCRLKPVDAGRSMLAVRGNPEITTDSLTIGFIRALVAAPRDAQFPSSPEAGASMLRSLARGVVAAYVATYSEPGSPEIGVYGEVLGAVHRRAATVDRIRTAAPLYAADGLHPTPAGSYLAALVVYAKVLNRSPVGLPARVRLRSGTVIAIDAQTAAMLQEVAAAAAAL
jgi:hypothetical protein